MGNLGGGEMLVILLVALIVLGPTKLPTAIRQVGRVVGEVRRIGAGFQQELREATEPLREPLMETKATLQAADKELREAAKPLKETAAALKAAADPGDPVASNAEGESTPPKAEPGEDEPDASEPSESEPSGSEPAVAGADDADDAEGSAGDAGADDSADAGSRADGTS